VQAELVVRGGLVDGAARDVVVSRGMIVDVTEAGAGGRGRKVIDATGLAVLPGAVDAHVHFDAPGRDEWEGWATGSLAAAAGGVTTVVDMPIDSDPPTTDVDAVRAKRAVAETSSLVDFALWGGLVPQNARDLGPLLDAGVVGLKAFLCDSGWPEFPACDPDALDRGMAAAALAGLPVAVHCEEPSLFEGGGSERPVASEVAAVARAGAAAVAHGARLHVVHCSSPDAVLEAKRWARTTVETCPHYLALNQDDVSRIGPDAACCPPIRGEGDRLRMVAQVADGTIDSVASDHSPCPPALKDGSSPFAGVAGVETALSVLLSLGEVSLRDIVRLRGAAAALCGLAHKGAVAPGYAADLALVDVGATWTVAPESLHSRHRRSPFLGRVLPGVVAATIVGGVVVYEAGGQAAEPSGRFLTPGAPGPDRREMERSP
jgi:allantoinase